MSFPIFGSYSPLLSAFNSPDQDPLSEGGKWDNLNTTHVDQLAITSHLAKCTATSTGESYWLPRTYGPFVDAYLTIATMPAAGNNIDISARIQQPGGNNSYDGYRVRMIESAGTDSLTVNRVDNGTITTLATLSRDFVAGEKIGIRCYGGSIEAWYWDGIKWNFGIVAYDLTYPSSGSVGFHIRGLTGRVSDVYAGDFSDPVQSDRPQILSGVGAK